MAAMAPKKSLVLAALLVVIAAAVVFVPQGAEAAASASATTSVRITGVVPCSAGNAIDVTKVAAFPNARVQLLCSGKVVTGATADATGSFIISLTNVRTNLLTVLMGNQCNVVVTTPLAACDASLARVTGTLTAPLKLLSATTASGGGLDLGGIIGLIGQIIGGLIGGILNLAPSNFSLV